MGISDLLSAVAIFISLISLVLSLIVFISAQTTDKLDRMKLTLEHLEESSSVFIGITSLYEKLIRKLESKGIEISPKHKELYQRLKKMEKDFEGLEADLYSIIKSNIAKVDIKAIILLQTRVKAAFIHCKALNDTINSDAQELLTEIDNPILKK